MLKIRNKPVRIIVRSLLYLMGIVLLLFVILSVYIEMNKKEILEKLRAGVSKNLRSEIQYKAADITIWRNFPYVGIHFKEVSIVDSVYHMPFVKVQEISGQVSLLQYFRKNIELRNVYAAHGVFHSFTDSSGYTNKYLLQVRKKGASAKKQEFFVNEVVLKDVRVIMENRKRNKLFDFWFKDLKADVSKDGETLDIDLENDAVINSMAFDLGKGSYLKGNSVKMNMGIMVDRKNATLSFDENKFLLNGQPYFMKGKFMMRDTGFFSLNIKTKNATYTNLKGVFPGNILSKLNKFDFEKPLDVSALIEGPLAYKTVPRILASWTVKDNVLKTDAVKFNNCSFTGSFNNEKVKGAGLTDENSEVILQDFTGNWEGIALSSKKISVTNLIHPYIDMSFGSATELANLNEKLGLRTIRFLNGKAVLGLSYTGPLETDISLLDRLNGRISFSNGTIQYIPRDFTFRNCSGNVFFSDNAINISNLQCDLEKNHFVVNVKGNNLSGLSHSDASKASIQCYVYSPALNIENIKGLFSARKTVSAAGKTQRIFNTASQIDNVMDHGNLNVILNATSVTYKNFKGQNLKGNIVFANNNLQVKNVSLSHANGKMELSADVNQSGNSNTASANVELQQVDVKKLFHAFNNFGQDGIASENMQGILNATTNINLAMDNNGSIVPGSIKGFVDFSLKNGALIDYEPIQQIKNFVLKKRDMSHLTFAELKNRLEINGYEIKINRMEVQSSAIGMFVDGVYDIKKEDTKINIQLPLKELKKRDSTYVPKNKGLDAKTGLSVYLEGKNDKKTGKVKFGLNTTRTLRKIF